jgi:dTDP-4-dehydrorhamnose 3,5-epimerase
MDIAETALPDVKIIVPRRFNDARGTFSETYNARSLTKLGITDVFMQDNHSYSITVGTIRGVHFQSPPFAQAKLIRVSRGRLLDIAVDLRRASPTFGKYIAVELSAENWTQLLIPVGFGHAFCTLEPHTEVVYKVSQPYAPEAEGGVLWSDPDLAIKWPVAVNAAVLSEKDKQLPRLRDVTSTF